MKHVCNAVLVLAFLATVGLTLGDTSAAPAAGTNPSARETTAPFEIRLDRIDSNLSGIDALIQKARSAADRTVKERPASEDTIRAFREAVETQVGFATRARLASSKLRAEYHRLLGVASRLGRDLAQLSRQRQRMSAAEYGRRKQAWILRFKRSLQEFQEVGAKIVWLDGALQDSIDRLRAIDEGILMLREAFATGA